MFFAVYTYASALTLPFPRVEQPRRPPLDGVQRPRLARIVTLRFHRVQART